MTVVVQELRAADVEPPAQVFIWCEGEPSYAVEDEYGTWLCARCRRKAQVVW